jgi:hypothetical protein
MPKLISIIVLLSVLNCTSYSSKKDKLTFYGEMISVENISNYQLLKEKTLKNGLTKTKLEGNIIETCPKKGCWMNLDTGSDTIFIRFRDYGFFVPTDSAIGKTAIIEGDLYLDTISVEMLRHYAEDAGKTAKEIALINEPSYNLNFMADGVIIKN